MKDCDFKSREFQIAVMNKLKEVQEDSERQLCELRNKVNAQKEHFTKEIKTNKKRTKQKL